LKKALEFNREVTGVREEIVTFLQSAHSSVTIADEVLFIFCHDAVAKR
jgi:hypothetical protein